MITFVMIKPHALGLTMLLCFLCRGLIPPKMGMIGVILLLEAVNSIPAIGCALIRSNVRMIFAALVLAARIRRIMHFVMTVFTVRAIRVMCLDPASSGIPRRDAQMFLHPTRVHMAANARTRSVIPRVFVRRFLSRSVRIAMDAVMSRA
jgi:hypothetical protein